MQKRLQITALTVAVCMSAISTRASAENRGPDGYTHSKGSDYYYKNCADAGGGIVLLECSELSISQSLANVYIGDQFEEGLLTTQDEKFRVLRSKHVPIVLPKEGYENVKDWVYGGRKYLKVKANVPTLVPGKMADVIVVVGNLGMLGGERKLVNVNSLDVQNNIVLTFWYNQDRGVEAVGVGNESVYFCARRPCLFAYGP